MDFSTIEQNYRQIDNLCSEAIRAANSNDINDDEKKQIDDLIFLTKKLHDDTNNLSNRQYSVKTGFDKSIFSSFVNHVKGINQQLNIPQNKPVLVDLRTAVNDFVNNTYVNEMVNYCHKSILSIENSISKIESSAEDIENSTKNISQFESELSSYGQVSKNVAKVISADTKDVARRLERINGQIITDALRRNDFKTAVSASSNLENIKQLSKELNENIKNSKKTNIIDLIDDINARLDIAARTSKNIASSKFETLDDVLAMFERINTVKESYDSLLKQRANILDLAAKEDQKTNQSEASKEIAASLEKINDILSAELSDYSENLNKKFDKKSLRSNEDINVELAKIFANSVQPMTNEFETVRNSRKILEENKLSKIPFVQQKNRLVSNTYQEIEIESFRRSIESPEYLKKQKTFMNKMTNQSSTAAFINSITANTIADGNMALKRSFSVFDSEYKKMTPREQANYDKIAKELRIQIDNTVNLINSLEIVDPDSKYLEQLKLLNAALVDREKAMSQAKNEDTKESLGNKIMSHLKGFWGSVNSALAIMGMGGLVSLARALEDIKNIEVETGKLLQQAAMTDVSLGASINEKANHDRIFNMGKRYYHMSAGQISLAATTQFYSALARSIAGRYSSTPEQNREDMSTFAKDLFAIKEANGLDNNDFNALIKYHYKDMGQDAKVVSEKIANIIEQAKSSNIPVKTFLNLSAGIASRSYELGMSAEKATDLMYSLTKRGMIVEDAQHLVIHSAEIAQRFGQNKSQVAYFGAISGMGFNLYGNMMRGRIFADRHGKPVENYRETMGKAMLAKYNMFYDFMSGGNENLPLAYFGRMLKEDGYSEKEVSMMMAMKKEGKDNEIEEILIGKNDREMKKKADLSKTIRDANQAIANMGSNTSLMQQILADRKNHLIRLAELWKQYFGPLIGKVVEFFDKILEELPKKVVEFVAFVRKLMNDPNAAKVVKSFGENPLLTMGVGITALGATYGISRALLKKGASWAGNTILHGVQNTFKVNLGAMPKSTVPKSIIPRFSGLKTMAKAGGVIGATALAATFLPDIKNLFSSKEKPSQENIDIKKETDSDPLFAFFKSGRAKMTLVNFDGSKLELDDDKTEQSAIDKTFKIALGVSILTIATRGIRLLWNSSTFRALTPKGIVKKMSVSETRNLNRYVENLKNNFKNAYQYVKPSNILHPSRFNLRLAKKNIAKVPRSVNNLTNAFLEAKNMPSVYKEQFKKVFGTETPKVKSVKDYFKLAKSMGEGTGITMLREMSKYRAANSTTRAMLSNAREYARGWWGLNLAVEGAMELSDAMSGNKRSLEERILRTGIGFGTSVVGAGAGAAIGQVLIPIPIVGAAIGSMIGGYAASKTGDLIKDKLGIGEKMDEATRNWVITMDETSRIRGVDIIKVLYSDTDQGELLRNYLAMNEVKLEDLNETQKDILKEIVRQNAAQNATLGQLLTDIAMKRKSINTEFGFGKGGLEKYLNDNDVLAKFYQEYAQNYEDDDELNTLYTHLSNYYYHPNAGSTDKEYWESERDEMRNLFGKTDPFAQRIKRNYVEMMKENYKDQYNAAVLALKAKKSTSSYFEDETDDTEVSDEEIADFLLKNISTAQTTELWQHIAEVQKSQPTVYQDLQKYIIEKYGQPDASSSGSIPMWLQGDERWGDMSPNGGSSMAAGGCFATSAAMMRAIYTGEMIDPGQFLQKGLWGAGAFAGSEWYDRLNMQTIDPASHEEAVAVVGKYLQSGRPIFAYHSGQDAIHPSTSVGHAVVYVGYNADGTIRVHDPAKGVVNISEEELLANAGKGNGNYYTHQVAFEVSDLTPALKVGGSAAPTTPPKTYSQEPQSKTSKSAGGTTALDELKEKNPQYYNWLTKYSREFGVDPYLAAAIMKTENEDFVGGKTSHAGAVGIMQLMPATAAELGVNPYDDEDNIKGGIKYLGRLSRQWNGHAGATAAAYNSGGGDGTGVKEYYETGDLSKLTRDETRKYVPKVLKYMNGKGDISYATKTVEQQKPLTIAEQMKAADNQIRSVAKIVSGDKPIVAGHLVDNMYVSPNAMSYKEKREKLMKRKHLNFKNERQMSQTKRQIAHSRQAEKLDKEIKEKQEELERQQEELIKQQKEQRKAELENVANVMIFGTMKRNEKGESFSFDDMMQEIYAVLNSNEWTDGINYIESG